MHFSVFMPPTHMFMCVAAEYLIVSVYRTLCTHFPADSHLGCILIHLQDCPGQCGPQMGVSLSLFVTCPQDKYRYLENGFKTFIAI